MKKHKIIVYFCLLYASLGNCMAVTEQQLSEQISKSVNTGDIHWLESSGQKFLAIFSEETTDISRGGIILLHDLGSNANRPDVIRPVREQLPGYGWAVLSIQLPVIDHKSSTENGAIDVKPIHGRITAAIDFFAQRGLQYIVLIGHGFGATAAASFIATENNSGIDAFIGIGMAVEPGSNGDSNGVSAGGTNLPEMLKKITVPTLDIYGARDSDQVRNTAVQRFHAARKAGRLASEQRVQQQTQLESTAREHVSSKAGFIAFRQVEVPGADHEFTGLEFILVKRIAGWLAKHAAAPDIGPSRQILP